MPIVAGAIDSNAAFFASGAGGEGDWNVTLGTTLAFKGIAQKSIEDPQGRVYCHRHPDGMWLPGGASNTGADWIKKEFEGRYQDYPVDAGDPPAKALVYPLVRQGERFPFLNNQAAGFVINSTGNKADLSRGLKLGLATVSPRPGATKLLTYTLGTDLLKRFTGFCTGYEVKNTKPAPDVYLAALGQIKTPADNTVAIEDTEHGVQAAQAAGLKTVVTPSEYTLDCVFAEATLIVPDLAHYKGNKQVTVDVLEALL
jgi:hypothetical protein